MRFHCGTIPDDFTPDSSWRQIREPGPFVMQLFALPIGVCVAVLIGYCWMLAGATGSIRVASQDAALFFTALVLSFPVIIIVHELLHAAVHPHVGRSDATVIGIWPKRLLIYAHYAGALSRDRFLMVFAAPFLVITILPLVLAAMGLLPENLVFWASWYSTWNALFACGDCLGFALILWQIPRDAVVRNQSWRTFWKPAAAAEIR